MVTKFDKGCKCAGCRYRRPDPEISKRGWVAYECGNVESEFYKSVLNVTAGGGMVDDIPWGGCGFGKPVDGEVAG